MTEQAMLEQPQSVTQIEIDQRVFDLYDEYCHGRIDRREFLLRAAAVAAGGLAMAQALMPRYNEAAAKLSWERTVAFFKKNLA